VSFDDPAAVAHYAEGPPRLVPGFADMQRMALIVLAERAPADAQVLVVGAGGGLEMKVFAEAQPGWRLTGVDPSSEMLKLAADVLGPLASRVDLIEGDIRAAPSGPYDAATCLLTLHILDAERRLLTLRDIRSRLKPGAPFVIAHHSFSQTPGDRERWLERYAPFAVSSGVPPENAERASAAIGARLPVLSPEHDERLLGDAGFGDIALFYAGFTFRGWVAYA